jgi:Polyketide cyclase / dehydrase and lipid transport
MTMRTITRSMESDASPDEVFRLLTDARRLPEWAPAFADRVDTDGPDGWKATKNGAAFRLEVAVVASARTVDYLRESVSGRKGGAYLRVQPRPGGGSVVVMTIPLFPGRPAEEADATLAQELESLARLTAASAP